MKRIIPFFLLLSISFTVFANSTRNPSVFGYSEEDYTVEERLEFEEIRLEWMETNYDRDLGRAIGLGSSGLAIVLGSVALAVIPTMVLTDSDMGSSVFAGAYAGYVGAILATPLFAASIAQLITMPKLSKVRSQRSKVRELQREAGVW